MDSAENELIVRPFAAPADYYGMIDYFHGQQTICCCAWRGPQQVTWPGFMRSVSIYFERFDLDIINVEPHANNQPPNRVLEKLGAQQ